MNTLALLHGVALLSPDAAEVGNIGLMISHLVPLRADSLIPDLIDALFLHILLGLRSQSPESVGAIRDEVDVDCILIEIIGPHSRSSESVGAITDEVVVDCILIE